MNEFPKFDPNRGAHLQIGATNLNKISLGQKSNQIQPGVGYRVSQTPGGTTVSVIKRRMKGGASDALCAFGAIVDVSDATEFTKGINGGIIYCGDKNFNVGYKGVNLETDGVWIVYLEIDCESNRDDDNEIILPGIKTSSETDPATFWQNDAWSIGPPETQYPDNSNPDVSDGIGTIIIPLGKLTIADGAASFAKTGCGNITVAQCGGTISHTRG